jgi:hypothetical protein
MKPSQDYQVCPTGDFAARGYMGREASNWRRMA